MELIDLLSYCTFECTPGLLLYTSNNINMCAKAERHHKFK